MAANLHSPCLICRLAPRWASARPAAGERRMSLTVQSRVYFYGIRLTLTESWHGQIGARINTHTGWKTVCLVVNHVRGLASIHLSTPLLALSLSPTQTNRWHGWNSPVSGDFPWVHLLAILLSSGQKNDPKLCLAALKYCFFNLIWQLLCVELGLEKGLALAIVKILAFRSFLAGQFKS